MTIKRVALHSQRSKGSWIKITRDAKSSGAITVDRKMSGSAVKSVNSTAVVKEPKAAAGLSSRYVHNSGFSAKSVGSGYAFRNAETLPKAAKQQARPVIDNPPRAEDLPIDQWKLSPIQVFSQLIAYGLAMKGECAWPSIVSEDGAIVLSWRKADRHLVVEIHEEFAFFSKMEYKEGTFDEEDGDLNASSDIEPYLRWIDGI